MGDLTLRDLDPALQASLRARASAHGRSPEEEAKAILRDALGAGETLATTMRDLFGSRGGVELDIPQRERSREPPDFTR